MDLKVGIHQPERQHFMSKQFKQSCAYCRQEGASREHYISEWMHPYVKDLVPARSAPGGSFAKYSDRGDLEFEERQKDQGRPRINDVTTRVCKACNQTWMSEIVNKAKPGMERLMFNGATDISPVDAGTISRWMILTWMSWGTKQANNPFSHGEMSEMRSGRMPEHLKVYMGNYNGQRRHAFLEGRSVGGLMDHKYYINIAFLGVFYIGSKCLLTMKGISPSMHWAGRIFDFGFRVIYPVREAGSNLANVSVITDDIGGKLSVEIAEIAASLEGVPNPNGVGFRPRFS